MQNNSLILSFVEGKKVSLMLCHLSLLDFLIPVQKLMVQ